MFLSLQQHQLVLGIRQDSVLRISYGVHPSPFGNCLLALTDRGICALTFLDSVEPVAALERLQKSWPWAVLTPEPGPTGRLVEIIFTEPDNRQPLDLFVNGTNFQIKVWKALLGIPWGQVCSYEDITRRIDRPGSARAVGAAVGSNSVAWLIPCHRVIEKSGHIGGYRWGTARKKAMLDWEADRNHGGQSCEFVVYSVEKSGSAKSQNDCVPA